MQKTTMPTKLIIGLGNPGREYAATRHNIGFRVIARFARATGIHLDRKLAQARTGSGERDGVRLVLARPQTFMNRSGLSVARLADRFGVPPEDIIVIHDDLDLSLGRIRLRCGWGTGGHKGITSIINELDSPDFIRVRIGIGRPVSPDSEVDIVDYVLSDFAPEEDPIVSRAIERASEALGCLLDDGPEAAMNAYNRTLAP